MWQFLVPLAVLIVSVHAEKNHPFLEHNDSQDRIFLKFPSSYANYTSDEWKLRETDDQLIVAVAFQASSHVGQIFSVRFIHPDGSLEALITAGIIAGNLQIDLFDGKNTKILNKPLENAPINLHEHSLALGINSTSRHLWYKIGSSPDVICEINKPIDIRNTEVTITVGGGGRAMIGCVTIYAVSARNNQPTAQGSQIAHQDIDVCPAADECTNRDCNTGRCKLLEVPTCDCYGTEMTGPNCRRPGSTLQLRNNDENDDASAFLRYTPWKPDQVVSRIAMDFKFSDSEAKEGILVYGETNDGQIFKIYVVGTKGIMVLGNENIMEFELRADDSRFHSVIVRLNNDSLSLYVDEVVQREHLNQTLYFKTVQFGAPIPTDVSEVGVTACVKDIYVDHHDIIDLFVYSNDSRVMATRMRPCIDDDASDINGIKMFSADPLVLLPDPEDVRSDDEDPLSANVFPVPNNKKRPRPTTTTSCEKPHAYLCQNGSECKKQSDTEFTCFCRDGYIGKFCQFTTLPRSCAEARDFLKLPDGATWIDVDGNQKLDPSVASCIDGVTHIPHDMIAGTVIRDAGFQNHSLFVLSYRDFNTWQLAKNIKNSGSCSQTINYRCNKAPLKFNEGKTWFKSVSNSTRRIKQIGSLEYSCPCLDTGCQSGEKCNCDSGGISEDIGELIEQNSGISEVVTLFSESDVRAQLTISDLKCKGYANEKPIRFTQSSELNVTRWTGESIDFQFRTTDASANILTVRGIYDENIINVALLDGHTVQIGHFEAVKIINSQNKLNDSHWHHVLIELAHEELRVTVDASHVLMTIGQNAVLEGSVVFGGDGNGLIGCIRNVLINDISIDLHEVAVGNTGISTTCDTHCTRDFCHNGAKCYEDFSLDTAFCRCAFPDVHSGANCEIDVNSNSSVSFHGGHLKFDNLSTVLTSSIYFSFRTDQTHSLLFFAHDQNNNFLQIHLSEEVNLTLTLNNLNIVSQCTVRAQPGTEFGDMRWIQVAVSHDSESSQLQVDEAACTIRTSRIPSQIPITRFHGVHNSEIVRMPIGFAAPPDPYTFTFIGNVDVGSKTNDGSFLLAPEYDSPIPRFYGCIRGLQIDRSMLDMRAKVQTLTKDPYGPARVHIGCDVGCSSVTCHNGGHCSVGWTNTDPSAQTTTCDCSRTSYAGLTCSLDEGVKLANNGFLEFDISQEMSRIFLVRNGRIPQLLKFAFSASRSDSLEDKAILATVIFQERRKLEIEINPNRTINVAITFENGKAEVLNFVGDFLDGYRHFVVVQTNKASATAVMIDSLRQDFQYRDLAQNIDMFTAISVKIGDRLTDTSDYNKFGFEGCISNLVIDYQRGSSLIYKPISYLATPSHHLSHLIESDKVTLGGCADFEVSNSLPVYQNRVKFPIWETDFKRFVYHGDIKSLDESADKTDWTQDDNGSILWIVFIVLLLFLVFLLIFFIFMKCCRERIHAKEGYPNEEDIPLNMTPTLLRQPQPNPPPQSPPAVSNYHIPNPNVDFNKDERAISITSSGISGYFTAQESAYNDDDEDYDVTAMTIQNEDDSDDETIRHIDDEITEEDGLSVVSRPTQVNHLPRRVSSFRTGDPTAPKDSPLYSSIRSPTQPVQVNVPVPPPRLPTNPKTTSI